MAKFILKSLLLFVVLVISGCAEFYSVKRGYADHVATVSDELVSDALFVICKGAPMGAIDRRFKTLDEKQARVILCGDSN